MNVEYKLIDDKYDKYDSYMTAINWDTKNTYMPSKEKICIEWLIQKMIGVYMNNEIIGLGCIKPYYKDGCLNAELSSIIKGEYRRRGLADKLLQCMLDYCKNNLNVEKVTVNILKTNLASISQIEKNSFDFVSFDDKIISFEKKLINKK